MPNHHGEFIWYELSTPDLPTAQAFYASVLGWQFSDDGASDRAGCLGLANDQPVIAMRPTPAAIAVPPAWLGYVAVDSVDAIIASLPGSGGAVVMPTVDVPGTGRQAMISDGQGAILCVIDNRGERTSTAFAPDGRHIGHCEWNELSTIDQPAALDFYGTRFGWAKDGEMPAGPDGRYEFLRHRDTVIGAMLPKMPEDSVSHWLYYFRAGDIDQAVRTIVDRGGTVSKPPMAIPGGTDFSVQAQDPGGAYFGLVGARG